MNKKTRIISERIELRPVSLPDEEDFLKALYGSTRDDVQYLPFDDAGKQAFILMQYAAQKKHYEEYYADADHFIVMCDGERAGRFIAESMEEEIRLVDLAILPKFRSSGIGTAIIQDYQGEGAESSRKCTLHVINGNPSIRLYERLGFVVTGENGMHHKMEWTPSASGTTKE